MDLRLEAHWRKHLAVGVAFLAVIAGWRTFVNWQLAPGGSVSPWLGITLVLGLLAAWCRFADQLWHIERNQLVHQVGVGPWTHLATTVMRIYKSCSDSAPTSTFHITGSMPSRMANLIFCWTGANRNCASSRPSSHSTPAGRPSLSRLAYSLQSDTSRLTPLG